MPISGVKIPRRIGRFRLEPRADQNLNLVESLLRENITYYQVHLFIRF